MWHESLSKFDRQKWGQSHVAQTQQFLRHVAIVSFTSEELSLSLEVEVANLCEAGTGIIHPDSRWQTCVK